jgi:hypothetical protein
MKFLNRDGRLVDPATRRLKFTDTSGYIKDRLVEIPHSSCPTHDAATDQVPKLHLWIEAPARDANNGSYGENRPGYATGERPSVPTQRSARQDQGLRDPTPFAGPATVNEMPVASPDQSRAEPRPLYDEGTPPSPASTPSPTSSMAAPDEDDGRPLYPPHEWNRPGTELDELGNERWIRGSGDRRRLIDGNSLRLSGTDANGKMWNAAVWGGSHPQQGEGSNIHPLDPEMRKMGDRMLTSLEHNSGNMVAGLASYQRLLNRAWARR